LLLLALGGGPAFLSAQTAVDSIRTDLVERYRAGERGLYWRSLTNACGT